MLWTTQSYLTKENVSTEKFVSGKKMKVLWSE